MGILERGPFLTNTTNFPSSFMLNRTPRSARRTRSSVNNYMTAHEFRFASSIAASRSWSVLSDACMTSSSSPHSIYIDQTLFSTAHSSNDFESSYIHCESLSRRHCLSGLHTIQIRGRLKKYYALHSYETGTLIHGCALDLGHITPSVSDIDLCNVNLKSKRCITPIAARKVTLTSESKMHLPEPVTAGLSDNSHISHAPNHMRRVCAQEAPSSSQRLDDGRSPLSLASAAAATSYTNSCVERVVSGRHLSNAIRPSHSFYSTDCAIPTAVSPDCVVGSTPAIMAETCTARCADTSGDICGHHTNSVVSSSAEDDVELCRFCFGGEDTINVFVQPCACRGSQRFVHSECLKKWQMYNSENPSVANFCKVCRCKFHGSSDRHIGHIILSTTYIVLSTTISFLMKMDWRVYLSAFYSVNFLLLHQIIVQLQISAPFTYVAYTLVTLPVFLFCSDICVEIFLWQQKYSYEDAIHAGLNGL